MAASVLDTEVAPLCCENKRLDKDPDHGRRFSPDPKKHM